MKVQGKQIGFLEVTRYKFEYIGNNPKIIIEQIKVLDIEGNYIKFAKLKEIEPFLSKFEIHFKPLNDA